jgi:hypothetical protein
LSIPVKANTFLNISPGLLILNIIRRLSPLARSSLKSTINRRELVQKNNRMAQDRYASVQNKKIK